MQQTELKPVTFTQMLKQEPYLFDLPFYNTCIVQLAKSK
jgi:hypothetical protein